MSEVHPAKVDARGSTPYFATLDDGTGLFAKVLGSQERAADLLFRVYRFLRLKNVGDDRPFSSLRRTVEHEALIALMARDIGVRTPRLRVVADVGDDSMLLAYEMIDGSSLDGVADEAVTDELMRAVWDQIALLHDHRIAHRDLRRANVFVQDDGTPWIIDFGFSEVAVPDGILEADVAQMLASFAVVAGAERSVAAADRGTRPRRGRRRAPAAAAEGAERRHPDCAEGPSGPAEGAPSRGRRPRPVSPTSSSNSWNGSAGNPSSSSRSSPPSRTSSSRSWPTSPASSTRSTRHSGGGPR